MSHSLSRHSAAEGDRKGDEIENEFHQRENEEESKELFWNERAKELKQKPDAPFTAYELVYMTLQSSYPSKLEPLQADVALILKRGDFDALDPEQRNYVNRRSRQESDEFKRLIWFGDFKAVGGVQDSPEHPET